MSKQVVYHSKTGHSRKLAGAIAHALQVSAYDIKDWPRDQMADYLFIVSGIYGGKTDGALLDFVKGLKPDRVSKIVLVTSCTAGRDDRADLKAALKTAGLAYLDEEFACPGSFLVFRLGRPNHRDLQNAADFALRVTGQAGQ